MPTTYFHRLWCVPCKEWTLHSEKFGTDCMNCHECKTAFRPVQVRDIPEDKIFEQRERYSKDQEQKEQDFLKAPFLMGGDTHSILSEKWPKPIIVEHDAGQEVIDKEVQRRQIEELKKKRAEKHKQQEEVLKYENLGRNEICLCGSGKKYKKCCLTKISKA